MEGYKVFEPDWTCRGFQYEVGKTFEKDDMTDEEKEQHPEYEVVGGYLKILDESECGQLWWDSLSERYKNIIKAMPNFDKEIFEDVTGIKI